MFVDVMVKKQIPARLQIDDDDEPKNYRIRRDGDRDLSFKGWKIGSGEHGTGGTSGYEKDWNRGVEVKIYLTVSGRFVVKIYHWTCWQGESPSHQATVCSSLEAVYDYLTEDCGGYLGPASKEAWEEACDAAPEFEIIETEAV